MSRSFLPPVLRGRIATNPQRLLGAAAAMLGLDICLFFDAGAVLILMNFMRVVVLIVLLLLSPRRWVAVLLALPACFIFGPYTPSSQGWENLVDYGRAILPLLLGIFIACPVPRRRVVYVEEEEP